jgi:hypothetical protein
MAGDREYHDMKIWCEDHKGAKKPFVVGYAWLDDRTGDFAFKLTGLPMPGAKTDFSGKIEKRGQRNGSGGGARGGGREPVDDSDIPFG